MIDFTDTASAQRHDTTKLQDETIQSLRSELATYRAAVVPVADYNRVCDQRDGYRAERNTAIVELGHTQRDLAETTLELDRTTAVLANARDSSQSVTLQRALDVMADVIRHYSRDVESSYSTYEKQGAWRAMVAMMVEAGR
jgi:exonuclease III